LLLKRPWGLHEIYPTLLVFIITLFTVNFISKYTSKSYEIITSNREKL
jgi:hypothetical protein